MASIICMKWKLTLNWGNIIDINTLLVVLGNPKSIIIL